MKKFLCLLLVLCISPVFALADQADDLIATLKDSNKAAVQSALVTADANHRSGQLYNIPIRFMDGIKEYTFTEEEYKKLESWVKGEYMPVLTGENLSPRENTANWKSANGYDFPIYGTTAADLTPISDYLSLLAENKILLSLPELQISEKAEYDWISSEIADGFWMLYRPYHDGSRYVLQLQLPHTYRPIDDAFTLLLVSTLSMDLADAEDLYGTLQYNIVNETCEIRTDEYIVTYSEPRLSSGKLAGFAVLEVTKYLK